MYTPFRGVQKEVKTKMKRLLTLVTALVMILTLVKVTSLKAKIRLFNFVLIRSILILKFPKCVLLKVMKS